MSSRYCIGIDLGTTNTVLSYVDTEQENPLPQHFAIPQLIAPGEIGNLNHLPSFIYLPEKDEIDTKLLKLPWSKSGNDLAIGEFARSMASTTPSKVVSSSKSWLCSDRIDRHSNCLPAIFDGSATRQISPVEAARLILEHLKDAWNHTMAAKDSSLLLEKQEVVITVPASFDAVARELTVEAATQVGLDFTLLEEPQAAFYAWLAEHNEDWRKHVSDGDVVLVCDLGGGTSDFSLIAVVDIDGDLTLQRLAVGEHTLLGGDNMDLTLAVAVSAKLKAEKGIQLNQRQFIALTHACRKAKEALASGNTNDQELVILGTGSGIVGGTITTKFSYQELNDVLIEGFFPETSIHDKPVEGRKTGLRTITLEYAADPAFTRHLAAFLDKHSFKDADGNPMLPGVVLFNGGVTKPDLFRNKIIDTLKTWNSASEQEIQVLNSENADQSVATGAAWLAYVKRAGGIRIKAGSPRSYYIGIESPMPAVPGFQPPVDALCVVNFGLEEGSSVKIDEQGLALVVGEPTEFRFFSSTTRNQDQIGDRFDASNCDDITEMPPLQVTLPADEDQKHPTMVPVTLRADLTDIGTLQIWCDSKQDNNSWKLEFDIR